MESNGGRSFLDVAVGARVFGLNTSHKLGRNDAGVDAFSEELASTAVTRVCDYMSQQVVPPIKQAVAPAVIEATEDRLRSRLEVVSTKIRGTLRSAVGDLVAGEIGRLLTIT